jgi:DNA-binding transcriptional LysR family regulator
MSSKANLRGARQHAEGTLRVVVPHAFGQKQLIAPLLQFMQRHPRITVEWLLHDRAPISSARASIAPSRSEKSTILRWSPSTWPRCRA